MVFGRAPGPFPREKMAAVNKTTRNRVSATSRARMGLLTLLTVACSAPDTYTIAPNYTQGDLWSRGGTLEEESVGLMVGIGWSPGDERRHREAQMERARAGGYAAPLVIEHASEAPDPQGAAEDSTGGVSGYLLGGVGAILLAVAALIKVITKKYAFDGGETDDA